MRRGGEIFFSSSTVEAMEIRKASEEADFEAMWSIFQAVVATGDTYVFSPTTSREDCHAYWFSPGMTSFVATEGPSIFGMYKFRANCKWGRAGGREPVRRGGGREGGVAGRRGFCPSTLSVAITSKS